MSNRFKNIWKEERGIAFPLFVVFLSTFLLMSVLVYDLSRVLIFRHQLQSIADAASLAGASAKSVQTIEDGSGFTMTGLEGEDVRTMTPGGSRVIGYNAIIDPIGAQREAQSAIVKNQILLEQMAGNNEYVTGWSGNMDGPTKYAVTVTGQIQTILMGKVQRLIGQTPTNTVTVQVKSTSGLTSL